MSNADKAVQWFNDRYEVRISNQITKRRRIKMESFIFGQLDDPSIIGRAPDHEVIECVDINIPRENLIRLITRLWYFERYNEHPAVKDAFDRYMMMIHLTEMEDPNGPQN